MKNKILTFILLLGSVALFAQQIDTTLVKELPLLKNTISKQQQEIDSLKNLIQNQTLVLQQQKDSINAWINETPTKNDFLKQSEKITVLQKRVKKQGQVLYRQKKSINELLSYYTQQNKTIDSLNKLITLNSQNITTNSEKLGTEIKKVSTKTETLNKNIGKNRLYWIIATLVILVLIILIYLFLGKRIKSSKTVIENQIQKTRQSLDEESVKLDTKLAEIIEKQLIILSEERKKPDSNIDHSLSIKVANEIVRMEKNINKIGPKTKGIKPLLKSLEIIKNNFAANGYEMINYINKEYDERMNVEVINFNTDDSLPEGKRIITRTIKPQVNYHGVLIQTAQVEVSQN